MANFYIFMTIALTVFGQIVIKWQTTAHGSKAGISLDGSLWQLFLQPWFLAAYGSAFVASLFWLLAVSRMDISRAYPFMSLSFPAVLLISHFWLGEQLAGLQIAGVALIMLGLALVSQS